MATHHTREIPALSDTERAELDRWVRRRKTSQSLALRARIILEAADGLSDKAVAEKLGTSRVTAGKWRRRFLDQRCDGLLDLPRPGTPCLNYHSGSSSDLFFRFTPCDGVKRAALTCYRSV